jgi:hypothetical protein
MTELRGGMRLKNEVQKVSLPERERDGVARRLA